VIGLVLDREEAGRTIPRDVQAPYLTGPPWPVHF
jgi:hypothetical protein